MALDHCRALTEPLPCPVLLRLRSGLELVIVGADDGAADKQRELGRLVVTLPRIETWLSRGGRDLLELVHAAEAVHRAFPGAKILGRAEAAAEDLRLRDELERQYPIMRRMRLARESQAESMR
jgi:hypothetical protein